MSWTREPLLHFLLFGAIVVALEGPGPVMDDERRVITVDAAVEADIDAQLRQTLGRAPSSEERHAAIGRWVRTEMLAREAARRGLAEGDAVVRSRLSRKMAMVLAASEIPDDPDDATLHAWYAAHADRYRVDARLTVRQLLASTESEAEALRLQLEAGADPRDIEARDPPGGPVLRSRTPERLAELFGSDWVDGLEDDWRVLQSQHGWHVARVESRVVGGQVPFEDARARVLLHWRTARAVEAEELAIDALSTAWEVEGWP